MISTLRVVLALLLVGALPHRAAPSPEQAAAAPDSESFIVQVDRPLHLAAGDRVGGVVVVGDTAIIDGTVVDPLVVVNGTARVSGTVGGSVIVLRGNLELAPSARIGHDVLLYRSRLTRAPGADIGGVVHERTVGFTFSERAFLLFWLSMTVAVIAAGLLFATFGAAQLAAAADLLRRDTGRALLATLVLWAGLPLLAVMVMATGIGISLGIGILVFLLPALWFIGYLVTGAFVGVKLLRLADQTRAAERPYLPILTGLVSLQLVGLVPGVGGFVALLAGLVGSGAIAARAWEVRRARRELEPAELPARPTA